MQMHRFPLSDANYNYNRNSKYNLKHNFHLQQTPSFSPILHPVPQNCGKLCGKTVENFCKETLSWPIHLSH